MQPTSRRGNAEGDALGCVCICFFLMAAVGVAIWHQLDRIADAAERTSPPPAVEKP